MRNLNAPLSIAPILKRADFLRARKGTVVRKSAFVLQHITNTNTSNMRYGITATKRLGNAVVRNRARRRLRAAITQLLPEHGHTEADYVLIARPAVLTQGWEDLLDDLCHALISVSNISGPKKG